MAAERQGGIDLLLQQARSDLRNGFGMGVLQAVALAAQATERVPARADAWGLLALSRAEQIWQVADADVPEVERRSRVAAERALALQVDEPVGRCALAIAPSWQGRQAAIETELAEILERHPSADDVLLTLADLRAEWGLWRDAALDYRTAAARMPLAARPASGLLETAWYAGHLGEAEAAAERASKFWPAHPWLWDTRFCFLMFNGRAGDALAMAEGVTFEGMALPMDVAKQVAWAFLSKDAASAALAVDAILAGRQSRRLASGLSAQFLAALGGLDKALDILEALLLQAPPVPSVRARRPIKTLFTPMLRSLWVQPRFGRLLEAIGLADHGQAGGRRPDLLAPA